MYVESNTVARSRKHYFSGKATMLSVYIVELHITVNNMKVFIVTQTCTLGKLISPAAVKRLYDFVCNARSFCSILTKFGFSRQIFIQMPVSNFTNIPCSGSRADTCGQTDGLR